MLLIYNFEFIYPYFHHKNLDKIFSTLNKRINVEKDEIPQKVSNTEMKLTQNKSALQY